MSMKINLLATIILTMSAFSSLSAQSTYPNRRAVMAGKFYPGDSAALQRYLEIEINQIILAPDSNRIRAIVAPHAGYSFSGEVAAHAFATLRDNPQYKNVFLIGSSHIAAFDGASVYPGGYFETPLGQVEVNDSIATELKKNEVFNNSSGPHLEEHCLEVELPFLQHVLSEGYKIIPIVIGNKDQHALNEISRLLLPYFNDDNLFVISTDLSHYPTYSDAIKSDTKVISGILTGSTEAYCKAVKESEEKEIENFRTAICGFSAVYIMLRLGELSGDKFNFQKLKYANSGDVSGDFSKVVGYTAIAMRHIPRSKVSDEDSLYFTDAEQKQLFILARNAILEGLNIKGDTLDEIGEHLRIKCGVFVTLYLNGQLKGCIGTFRQDQEICENISEMAYAAAFNDRRFSPVSKEEYDNIEIEISVLTPMQRIEEIEEIEIGKHGIYIKQGILSGTYLPQVATENGWDAEEFVSHCSQYKAGIGKDGWKNKSTEIYIYETLIYKEK